MAIAAVNGIEIYYDSFGAESDPALLLMAGLGSQLINYPDELCLAFVDRGLRVVRFDNRDAGLSSEMEDGDEYTLSDMANDVVGLLDHLGLDQAHIWGSSMGGMIAQTMAIEHPTRVRSLISVQSSTGEPEVGQPDPDVLAGLLESIQPSSDRTGAIDGAIRLADLCVNNPLVSDLVAHRVKAELAYDRSYRPGGVARQAAATMGAPSWVDGLRGLPMAALVIHGNRDPLIDISGGRRTAELIPNSRFVEIDGMGHDLTPVFWTQYVDAVIAHIAEVEAAATASE